MRRSNVASDIHLIDSVLQKVTKRLPDLVGVHLSGPGHWHLAREQDVPTFTTLTKLEAVPIKGAVRGDVEHYLVRRRVEGGPRYLTHFRLKGSDYISPTGQWYTNVPGHQGAVVLAIAGAVHGAGHRGLEVWERCSTGLADDALSILKLEGVLLPLGCWIVRDKVIIIQAAARLGRFKA